MYISINLNYENFRYEKDTNAIPPVMILQPISSILPNFMNKLIPEKQEEDQQKWWETLCKLQKLLRDATTYLHRVIRNLLHVVFTE
jgi:hypothetical protein